MTAPPPLDLSDIQGDIIIGIPKRAEDFIFFTIADVFTFRSVVGSEQFMNLITPAFNAQNFRNRIREQKAQFAGSNVPLIPLAAVNIAFTQPGLALLGLNDDIGDPSFNQGQFANAQQLGDNGRVVNGVFDPDWLPAFKGAIHGVILVAGDSPQSIQNMIATLVVVLRNSITQILRISGHSRPGPEKGHEHFGYMDGISDPAVEGVVSPLPGQQVIPPGVLLMGHPGDIRASQRPAWAINGSILVYRHLDQLVPEFDNFKLQNALFPGQLTRQEGADFLGARLFGRWKSGAPTDLAPLRDDPALAVDPMRNNNFNFSNPTDQTACPFAAHIRKTNPRSDLPNPAVAGHSIHRAGIPFGPEVTDFERFQNRTFLERGLAFACYQSNLSEGFEFMQKSWANNINFIFGKIVNGGPFNPGFDPIIGQNGQPNGRAMAGYDPRAQGNVLPMPEFVVSRGGAYFFSPSISTLRTRIGIPAGGAPIAPVSGITPIGGGGPIFPIGGIVPVGGIAPLGSIVPVGSIIPIGGNQAPVVPVGPIIPIGGNQAPVVPVGPIVPIGGGGPIFPA